jgi:hypothetical protein
MLHTALPQLLMIRLYCWFCTSSIKVRSFFLQASIQSHMLMLFNKRAPEVWDQSCQETCLCVKWQKTSPLCFSRCFLSSWESRHTLSPISSPIWEPSWLCVFGTWT